MAEKVKIGTMWLGGCSGCHIALTDLHELLLDVLEAVEFQFSPVLMDTKYDEIPEMDILLIEGGIRNEENRELAEVLREKAGFVIAYGSCAEFGGVPGLGNLHTNDELTTEAYINSVSTVNPDGIIPSESVPHLESRVRPLSDVIKVDAALPGCPPKSEVIAQVLLALLDGETPEIPDNNLCDVCEREKPPMGMAMDKIKRPWEVGETDRDMCLVPQGVICLGPATRPLCGAQCPSVDTPCRGCYGPTDKVLDAGAKMISAIASDYGVENDKEIDPEEVANQVEDVVGTFYTYTLPAALIPLKLRN
ncbi:MAG: F420-nonreducing hydrogenase [Methanosphaera sp.]|jgi:F420-non-reducing hydrogenase small subunit|nr:F420-nonreducing hydrogenase [Methanosphaera sp.]